LLTADEIRRVKRILRLLAASFLYHTGLIRLLNVIVNRYEPADARAGGRVSFLQPRRSRNFQILVYHRVDDAVDQGLPSMPVATFRRQMEYLARHFSVCALEDVTDVERRERIPENAVVITLDDGYRDNYRNAFPILRELSLPATIFLATGSIGSGKILWHDRVFRAFGRTTESSLPEFGPERTTYPLGSRQERRASRDRVLRFLKTLDGEARLGWIDQLVEKLEVQDPCTDRDLMLDWDEVRKMHQAGISFGSHTVTHAILSALGPGRARQELVDSKRTIERELGAPVRCFAYPNGKAGDFNEETKAILREAGYSCALTTIFGTNPCGGPEAGQDPMELKRIGIAPTRVSMFATRMNLSKFS
jgi:peptidoglycan/xylan/chitin deacetylase (PgdA/CDA1 family)